MMYRERIAIALLSIFLGGCDRVILRDEKPKLVSETVIKDEFLLDSKGGLFNNLKWYHYSMDTHIIWTLFDIYSIKTPVGSYYLQFGSYYSQGAAGKIALQIRNHQESKIRQVEIDAEACGNPYTNPDYESCLKDPHKNGFTYLNLRTLEILKLSPEEALTSSEWDIAFKSTAIKLNSGTSGPSSVVGALAKRFGQFFDENGRPIPTRLSNVTLQDDARKGFRTYAGEGSLIYYLQDGLDRVIHEKFWLQESDGKRKSAEDVWWSVRSHNEADVFHFSIEDIDESIEEEGIFTEMSLDVLGSGKIKIHFSTQKKIENICINFVQEESFPCSSRSDWDIKFTIINQFKNSQWVRDWRVFTQKGAQGPFSSTEIKI